MAGHKPKSPNSLWKRILYYRLPVSDHAGESIVTVIKFTISVWLITCLLACVTGFFVSPGRGSEYERVDSSRWIVYHASVWIFGALLGIAWHYWSNPKVKRRWAVVCLLAALIFAGFAFDVIRDDMKGRLEYVHLRETMTHIQAVLRERKDNGEIKTLLAAEPDLPVRFVKWERGGTLVRTLARDQHPDAVHFLKAMINAGFDPNMRNDPWNDGSFLLAATYENTRDHSDVSLQKLLLEKGADPNLANHQGRTPLHLAAASNAGVPFARLLLEHGAKVNAVDQSGWTPLHIAAVNGNPDVVQFLLAAAADPHAKDANHQLTPYDLAAGGYDFDFEGKLTKRSGQPSWPHRVIFDAGSEPGGKPSHAKNPIARVIAILAPLMLDDNTPTTQ